MRDPDRQYRLPETQWEYHCINAPSPATKAQVEVLLNDLGKDGWELAGTNYGWFILKRPIPKED